MRMRSDRRRTAVPEDLFAGSAREFRRSSRAKESPHREIAIRTCSIRRGKFKWNARLSTDPIGESARNPRFAPSAPVPQYRLNERERRDRGGVGAQDARAERGPGPVPEPRERLSPFPAKAPFPAPPPAHP